MSKSEMAEKDASGIGMKIASEAITNIRTVASLSELLKLRACAHKLSHETLIYSCLTQGKRAHRLCALPKKWRMSNELHAKRRLGVA